MPKLDPEVFKERLETYRRALERFAAALAMPQDTEKFYLDTAAHRFIYCYELTWKSLRRMLRMRGIQANSPVMAFRHAYAEGWLENKALYEKMIEDRNIVTHEYFEEKAVEVYARLPNYLHEMQKLATRMEMIYSQEPDGI
jgi:nucleotidyltransferase substrate binding protein (TIGR01987 family)